MAENTLKIVVDTVDDVDAVDSVDTVDGNKVYQQFDGTYALVPTKGRPIRSANDSMETQLMGEREHSAGTIPDGYQYYPQALQDLMNCIERSLRLSIPADQCAHLAFSIAENIRQEFKGCLLYIGTGKNMERKQRNAAICQEFDGQNQPQLARRYGLTLQTVYDILAKNRKG